ncbi:hypothetical protein PBV87_21810 [Niameybacter massiliensis]|uniref:Outer membrane lipoprotein carrier protein LolA n=1 Tax=Holtiella tumoricola TaxID=3018743 RepID=A0AA42DRQ4_9FIRM|nr:hypothetical protein [Holtiella tumoricola]MDA3734115.1 hypothetical protein [Holtiella tumoricola]
MYKLKRILVIGCILLLAGAVWGCQNPALGTKSVQSIEDMLKNLKNYESDLSITFTKNKDESNIKVKQVYNEDGTYQTTILEPERLKGYCTTYDGNTMSEYHPSTGETIQTKVSPVLNQLLFGTFVKQYKENPAQATDSTITIPIPGRFRYMASEKVWFDEQTKYPKKMEIYDTEGNLTISIVFESFGYNSIK